MWRDGEAVPRPYKQPATSPVGATHCVALLQQICMWREGEAVFRPCTIRFKFWKRYTRCRHGVEACPVLHLPANELEAHRAFELDLRLLARLPVGLTLARL